MANTYPILFYIVIQIKILNAILYFLILYIDVDVSYNFILVSSLCIWDDYWLKHVGEHTIYKKT